MGYIAAFDIGIASVGWAVIDKEKERVIESGANLFPEANPAENKTRRDVRDARRTTRREKTRLRDFDKMWEAYGFSIPSDPMVNIVDLKVKALTDEISLDSL